MRVAIDGIAASHPQPGGYHTYTTNLVKHLALLAREDSLVVYVDRPSDFGADSGLDVEILPAALPWVGVAFREQVALPARLRRSRPDLLHSPCATGPLLSACPSIVTLFDTIEFSLPLPGPRNPRFWAMRFYSRLIQARMALTAQRIITISQYSKAQIMRRFGLPADRITVTYLAPGSSFHSRDRSAAQTRIQQTFGLGEYIVALASASPRKNIGHLLQAYAQLATPLRRRFALVLVCSHSLLRESLSHQAERLGISADLVSIDRVEDDCLADLFTAAAVFAFPSLEEGFGLPPLEAMACGTPVIASRTSSMPEVLGRSALLVSPTDSAELADALTNVLTDVDLSRHLIERGRRRSEFFNWPETARQTLAAYHSLAPA